MSADRTASSPRPPGVERALRFIRRPDADRFDDAAREVFRFQVERHPAYRRFCEGRGVGPGTVRTWEEIPCLPTAAFTLPDLFAEAASRPERVFLTSGTTRGKAGRGRHPFPDLSLYEAAWETPFRKHVLPDRDRLRILSLVPEEIRHPESSLAYMVGRILERCGTPDSRCLLGRDERLAEPGLAPLTQAAAGTEPVLLIGTGLAYLALLDLLEARGRRLRLPPESRLLDTGGSKGRAGGSTRPELLGRYEALLGIPPERVIGEYGMTELASQFYETSWTEHRAGWKPREPRVFRGPPWIRTRVLDSRTLTSLPEGAPGLLAHVDLANAWTVSAILTEDLGTRTGDGFVLHGRAQGAELRGCSLLTEELLGG